jgi:NitT/TauT family transport system permease protein
VNARRLASTAVPPALFAAAVLLAWNVSSYAQFDDARRRSIAQPAPLDVVRVGFLKTRNLSEMLDGLALTTRITLLGLLASMGVGVVLAVVMSQSRLVEKSVFPYAVVLQTVPIIALTPVIKISLGSGLLPRVLICLLIAVFPIITNTLFGLKAAERSQHDLFTLHGASRWTRLWKLQFPAALPAMFTGFRISAGLAVIGAIVAEFFFGTGPKGLGRLISEYTQRNETAKVMAAVTFTAALGIALFLIFGWLSHRLTRHWRAADPLGR